VTFGGYSQSVSSSNSNLFLIYNCSCKHNLPRPCWQLVCDEKYVLRIPDALPLDKAAPLLCAGIMGGIQFFRYNDAHFPAGLKA
jgi:hypothetical protein